MDSHRSTQQTRFFKTFIFSSCSITYPAYLSHTMMFNLCWAPKGEISRALRPVSLCSLVFKPGNSFPGVVQVVLVDLLVIFRNVDCSRVSDRREG